MNVLALDTCLGAISVAVRWRTGAHEWLMRECYEEMTTGQAERLMPMISDVMSAAGIDFVQLDRVAVTSGPGSFTGVRVGVAAARALALAAGLEVVAMTSLSVIAARAEEQLQARGDRRLVVAVDARRGALYVQMIGQRRGDVASHAEVLQPDEAAARLTGHPAIVVGSGADALVRAAAGMGNTEIEAALTNLQPHARVLALKAPVLRPVADLKPLYVRLPDAKPQSGASLPRAD